jgi:hydrogenase expression/formation protein HypC
MCLGIPVKIISRQDQRGIAEINGVTREIDLRLIEDVNIGDYVILHAGFGIQKIDEREALETLTLLRQMATL